MLPRSTPQHRVVRLAQLGNYRLSRGLALRGSPLAVDNLATSARWYPAKLYQSALAASLFCYVARACHIDQTDRPCLSRLPYFILSSTPNRTDACAAPPSQPTSSSKGIGQPTPSPYPPACKGATLVSCTRTSKAS